MSEETKRRVSPGGRSLTPTEASKHLEEHGPIWEVLEPRLSRCSLCSAKLDRDDKPILEVRRSGPAGRQQLWPYCAPCALAHMGRGISPEASGRLRRTMAHYDGESSIPQSDSGYVNKGSTFDISGAWLLPSLDEVFDFAGSHFGAKQS